MMSVSDALREYARRQRRHAWARLLEDLQTKTVYTGPQVRASGDNSPDRPLRLPRAEDDRPDDYPDDSDPESPPPY